MRWSWLAALVGTLCACVLELDAEIACGDGYVHAEAGEECDPGDEQSYIGACENERQGRCDPVTCQIDYSGCFSPCGNGVIEPERGEECEADIDDFAASGHGKPCVEIDADGPTRYAGGVVRGCTGCKYDRSDCHWCGDGQRRVAEPFSEVCDGLDVVPEERADFCFTQCVTPDVDPAPTSVQCQARCQDDCNGFEFPDDGKHCCLPSGETKVPQIPCCNPPAPGDPSQCGPGFGGWS
jgi:hypothetical protein